MEVPFSFPPSLFLAKIMNNQKYTPHSSYPLFNVFSNILLTLPTIRHDILGYSERFSGIQRYGPIHRLRRLHHYLFGRFDARWFGWRFDNTFDIRCDWFIIFIIINSIGLIRFYKQYDITEPLRTEIGRFTKMLLCENRMGLITDIDDDT